MNTEKSIYYNLGTKLKTIITINLKNKALRKVG